MRLGGGQSSSRPAAIDRNPINRTQQSNTGAVAPHGTTTRWTYTVPAGKKALGKPLTLLVQRGTAATTAGIATCQFNYTPSGGASAMFAQIIILTNGVGDFAVANALDFGDLLTGDSIAATDSDASNTGTVAFVADLKAFEYDG